MLEELAIVNPRRRVGTSITRQQRMQLVHDEYNSGASATKLADKYGISRQQIYKDIADYQGTLSDAVERGVQAAILDGLFATIVFDIHNSKPDPKFSAT